MSGRVVHFEIPADDLARAQAFYRDAFGWTIDPMPEWEYAMAMTTPADESGAPTEPGGINGGMMRRQDPITTPVITIEVDDIERALEQIDKLGGATVQPKIPVGELGFSAYFKDTEGNVVGLWQGVQPG